MNYSKEMIEKAKTAASAAELIEMAKAEGVALSTEDAELYFSFLTKGMQPLSEEELDCVAGGKGKPDPKYKTGQRIVFWDPQGVDHYGWIVKINWVDLQNAYYYVCGMDDGTEMKFPLESSICPAKVIS